MNDKTLYLFEDGPIFVRPVEGDDDQLHTLMHFSGGSSAITKDRIDEIAAVAALHGWSVLVKECLDNPTKPPTLNPT